MLIRSSLAKPIEVPKLQGSNLKQRNTIAQVASSSRDSLTKSLEESIAHKSVETRLSKKSSQRLID